MPDNPPPTPQDLLKAELVISWIVQNRAIQFQLEGDQMTPDQAKKHFDQRRSLSHASLILLDEAEAMMGDNS